MTEGIRYEPSAISLRGLVFIDDQGRDSVFDATVHGKLAGAVSERLSAAASEGSAVGLIFRTGPDLVAAWLGCILAGREPLILQYPTSKQNRLYWTESVGHTLAMARVAAVIVDDAAVMEGLAHNTQVICVQELDRSAHPAADGFALPAAFSILQLSSGTTGFRKAIRFTHAQLRRHAIDYNEVLGLGEADTIVSWLPLYHDMGYIACFVMPLILGIRCVMMDPMIWVRRPELLYDAIERHGGSLCYMPNFGFEIMSRLPRRSLPRMRGWISCSEPVSARTIERFVASVEAPDATFLACYAMAENVFAVTFGKAYAIDVDDGPKLVSCGAPIPGVSVKLKDGEIWVKSPTSLAAYLDGRDIRDEDGFYPTGDLGEMIDGELYVSGRKQDLLIQAGRKTMLSDIDLAANEVMPQIRGRAAAIALRDDRLGTEVPLLLIEAEDFAEKGDSGPLEQQIQARTGLDSLKVGFVPPRFLTKTSSGKFNRKEIGRHWQAVRQSCQGGAMRGANASERLRNVFGTAPQDQPVGSILDSLSLAVLRIELDDAGKAYDPRQTLAEIIGDLSSADENGADAAPETLRIVSFADRLTVARTEQRHLEKLGQKLGMEVTFEHLCLPPSPIVLSDLIFRDYFGPRIDETLLTALDSSFARLRGASVLICDDMAEMYLLYAQSYAVLSHALERDPRSDLISTRWQSHVRQHHLLPTTVVAGIDIPLKVAGTSPERLGRYLGVPLFRIANIPGFAPYTEGWDFRPLRGDSIAGTDPDLLFGGLGEWLTAQRDRILPRPRRPGPGVQMNDLHHFCSHSVRQSAIDQLVDRYDSFCLFGHESSLPYLRARIADQGKRFAILPSYAPRMLATLEGDYDCYVACGAVGPIKTDKPFVALQHVAQPWRVLNLSDFLPDSHLNEMPRSGTEWHHPFEFARMQDYGIWSRTREDLAR